MKFENIIRMRGPLFILTFIALISGCATSHSARGNAADMGLARGHVVILVPVFIMIPSGDDPSKDDSASPPDSLPPGQAIHGRQVRPPSLLIKL
jgi:hypothetical protein